MAGLVPAIHVFDIAHVPRRGCHQNSGLPEFWDSSSGESRVNPTFADKRGHDGREIAPLVLEQIFTRWPGRLRLTAMGNGDRSIQQACLAHALGNPFGVRWILEWQTIHMIFK